MTSNQNIFQTMTTRTLVTMDANVGFWKLKLKTKGKVDKVRTIATEIDTLAKQQGHSTSGATDTKNDQRITAAIQALFVDDVLKSYYEDNDDKLNAAIIDFTMSDFTKGTVKHSITNMQLVCDTAAAIILKTPTALDEFNLSITDLPDLQTAIDLLSAVVPTQSVMKSGNKTITADIAKKFVELRAAMTGLDTNVNTYSKISSKFVDDYTNCRRMVQTGVGHVTAEAALMPIHFEALLGKSYTIGDVLTIKNHSLFNAKYGFTNTPEVLPIVLKDIEGGAVVKETIVKDDKGSFGHWLVVYNPNDMDDVDITVLVAKG